MQQDGEALAVEHQPRQKPGQHLAWKRDLVHRARMGADAFVMPAPELRIRKLRADALTQVIGTVAASNGVVIDVGVVMRDRRRIRRGARVSSFRHRELPRYSYKT